MRDEVKEAIAYLLSQQIEHYEGTPENPMPADRLELLKEGYEELSAEGFSGDVRESWGSDLK